MAEPARGWTSDLASDNIISMSLPSSRFGAGVHPDIPTFITHFVGRARGGHTVPYWADPSPPNRMTSILHGGYIRLESVFGTSSPVACFSEVSLTGIRKLFSTGVTPRGPYSPWALLFDRDLLITAGVRPVWYMTDEDLYATSELPAALRDRRVSFRPGSSDWLAEREWRYCWGDAPILPNHFPTLSLFPALIAVVVPERGWCPPPIASPLAGGLTDLRFAMAAHGVPRLYWDGTDVLSDGQLDINAQRASFVA